MSAQDVVETVAGQKFHRARPEQLPATDVCARSSRLVSLLQLRELEETTEYLQDVQKQLDRELQARQDDAVFISELTRECADLRSSLKAATADLHAAQTLNAEMAGENIRENVCTASISVRARSESRRHLLCVRLSVVHPG